MLKLPNVLVFVHAIALQLQHLRLFASQLMPQREALLLVLQLYLLHIFSMLQC